MDTKTIKAAQDYFITEAANYERSRDAAPFESKFYWEMHDAAINLLTAAESLMPGQGWDYCQSAWRPIGKESMADILALKAR